MQDVFNRIWENLVDRSNGPLALRFVLQPVVATVLAIRDGRRDAREGRSPYFWTIVSDPSERRARLREGLVATGKVMALAFALDVIYQFIRFDTFHPDEALIVAFLLGFLPYLIIRGPADRIARWWSRPGPKAGKTTT